MPATKPPIVCDIPPVYCRKATWVPCGAAGLALVNPLSFDEMPASPVNVQLLSVSPV